MSDVEAREALRLWEQAGLIDQAKADQLGEYLTEHAPAHGSSRLVRIVSVFGAVLVGLGMILFVASHWSAMSPALRIAALLLAYAAVAESAVVSARRGYERVSRSLWFLATLTVGAEIFLVGQIFNLSLTFWQGPFIWLVATLAMGYALSSRLHAWLAIPLALLVLGWLGGGKAWFTDDQLEFLYSDHGLRPVLSLLGLGLAALALLVERSPGWRFASDTWLVWGVLLTAAPLVLATADDSLLFELFQLDFTPKQWAIIGGCTALVGLALWTGHPASVRNRMLMAVTAILLLGALVLGSNDAVVRGDVYALFVVVVFLLALALIWAGVEAEHPALVNLGVASAACIVLIQYFSWSLRLLDRSLAFIVGGIVLIGLSVWIEKQRRRLLARIAR